MPALLALLLLFLISGRAPGQTDFYNTDRGRPIQIEDAYPTERYAFELKLAPIRLERANGGVYNWGLDPEIAYGILPRTQLELGVPLSYIDKGARGRSYGLGGLEVSAMHNLNVETEGIPALGLRADLLAPVGGLAADRAYGSLTGMVTRTYHWARFHFNGQYTFGSAPETSTEQNALIETSLGAVELSRWLAGVAIDKTYPLRSTLITAELYARRPIHAAPDVEWSTGAGIRYQWSPRLALDAGLGRRLTGEDPAWFITFGTAYAFAVGGLMPGMGR